MYTDSSSMYIKRIRVYVIDSVRNYRMIASLAYLLTSANITRNNDPLYLASAK